MCVKLPGTVAVQWREARASLAPQLPPVGLPLLHQPIRHVTDHVTDHVTAHYQWRS